MENLNKRQLGKIDAFNNVLNTIGLWETQVDGGLTWQSIDKLGSESKKVTHIFRINSKLMGVLDRVGFQMYLDFEAESPEMKLAADKLLLQHQELKSVAREESIKPLITIWEASE